MSLTGNDEAEQAILSAVLLDPTVLGGVHALLEPADFFQKANARIMTAMLRMAANAREIDAITLADELESHGELNAIGGKDYIGRLLGVVATAANVGYHAEIVLRLSQRRALAAAFDEGKRLAIEGLTSPAALAKEVGVALATVDRASTRGLSPAVRALHVTDPEPVRFLIEDLATVGEIALLFGDGGSFKSSAAIHMAGAIAGGYSVFDRFKTSSGPVLIVSAEDSESVIRMRLKAFVAGHGWHPGRVLSNVHILADGAATLAAESWRRHFCEEARRVGAKMVVLDPLADLLSGDENSNSEMRAVLRFARLLSSTTGATPLIVHHAGKAGQEKRTLDRIRGASALASGARTILHLSHANTRVHVEHLKMSRAEKLPPFDLQVAISSDPLNRATWLSARLTIAKNHVIGDLRGEDFVLAQVTASPHEFTTTDLKKAAIGTGISGEDVSRALSSLQDRRRIAFDPGAGNAKRWYAVVSREAPSRIHPETLPILPDDCRASSRELAVENKTVTNQNGSRPSVGP